jgi:hypothetical protein
MTKIHAIKTHADYLLHDVESLTVREQTAGIFCTTPVKNSEYTVSKAWLAGCI